MNRPDHEDGPGTQLDFDEVFRAHFDAVWRVARSLAGPGAADDVTQDAFIVVRRLLPRYATGSLRAWLFAIVRNVARNHLRSHRRRQRNLEALAEPPPDRSPEEWLELQDAARKLDAFTASLPEPQRVAFVLMDVEGLTAAEVAEALDVPTRTVYSRLRVAREAFARFAQRIGATEARS